jgi:hypothetical protein
VDRPASETVYCSCRCENVQGNTNDGASYCTCPTGFTCTQVYSSVGTAGDAISGGYCIKTGTAYDASAGCFPVCSPSTNPCQ